MDAMRPKPRKWLRSLSGGEASELFEAGEPALDAVALLVEPPVAGSGAFGSGWDHGLGGELTQGVVEGVGVVGLVSEDGSGPQAFDQRSGLDHVVPMAGREDQTDRQSERIDASVDLGPEPTARTALLRAAPAACAWARIDHDRDHDAIRRNRLIVESWSKFKK
jgi:hypothetical protein